MSLIALSLASTAISAVGQYQSALGQAKALQKQAAQTEATVEEMLFRNKLNNDIIERESVQFIGTQRAQIAASGGGVTATSAALLEQTVSFAAEEIANNTRAIEWDARNKLLEARTMRESAADIKRAGIFSALGTAGFGAARTLDSAPASTSNLPKG